MGEEGEKVSAMVRKGGERSRQDMFAMREVEENGICEAIQTLLGAAETGSRQTSAPTGATGSLGQYGHS
jgi:hypothetical protein